MIEPDPAFEEVVAKAEKHIRLHSTWEIQPSVWVDSMVYRFPFCTLSGEEGYFQISYIGPRKGLLECYFFGKFWAQRMQVISLDAKA